jgi:hypothetical protein
LEQIFPATEFWIANLQSNCLIFEAFKIAPTEESYEHQESWDKFLNHPFEGLQEASGNQCVNQVTKNGRPFKSKIH